jgi:hypothetical protein
MKRSARDHRPVWERHGAETMTQEAQHD